MVRRYNVVLSINVLTSLRLSAPHQAVWPDWRFSAPNPLPSGYAIPLLTSSMAHEMLT
jgi:hypothetical protein